MISPPYDNKSMSIENYTNGTFHVAQFISTTVFYLLYSVTDSNHQSVKNFQQYIHRILTVTTNNVTSPVILTSLLYLSRFVNKQTVMGLSIPPEQEFQLWTTSLMLADVYLNDAAYAVKSWSQVTKTPISDCIKMRKMFLETINYDLHVTEQDYGNWITSLQRMSAQMSPLIYYKAQPVTVYPQQVMVVQPLMRPVRDQMVLSPVPTWNAQAIPSPPVFGTTSPYPIKYQSIDNTAQRVNWISNRSASPYQSGSYSYPFNKSKSPTNRYRPTSPPINDLSDSDLQDSDSTVQEKDVRVLQQEDDVWTQDRDDKRIVDEYRFQNDLNYQDEWNYNDDRQFDRLGDPTQRFHEQMHDSRLQAPNQDQMYNENFTTLRFQDPAQNQRFHDQRYPSKRYIDNFNNPDVKELSDSEHEDNNTVRAQSPAPDYFEFKQRAKSPIVDEVDTDAKLVGFALMFTLFYFVALHVFPVLELFPVLLHAKMGNVVASVVLVLISISLGYNTALQRLMWVRYFKKLRRHRMFSSCFYFTVLATNLYLSKYVTGWIFSVLFQINHIPILGSIIVLGILAGIIFLFGITTLYTSATFSYSVTSKIYDSLFKPNVDVYPRNSPSRQSGRRIFIANSQI
ncbi:hypothetical protein HDV01_004545 [Terramyces sp. JEL0728]|nr:hypothetical protein HDV01_004545 [Terramyces sp. JEL0728]